MGYIINHTAIIHEALGMKILIEIFFLTQEIYIYSRNRGNEVTLVKDRCRLNIRKYSFSQSTIN